MQEKETILPEDNVGSLYVRLMNNGAKLVQKTVRKIAENNIEPFPQNINQVLNSAPKIFKETCEIDWNDEAEIIHNFVRGLSPYPAAWTKLNDKQLKVYQTSIIPKKATDPDEDIYTDGKNFLYFNTTTDWIAIDELQLQGKKRMKIADFLRGYKF